MNTSASNRHVAVVPVFLAAAVLIAAAGAGSSAARPLTAGIGRQPAFLPPIPPMKLPPGAKKRVFTIFADGTQTANWDITLVKPNPSCTFTEAGKGSQTLTFTSQPDTYTFVGLRNVGVFRPDDSLVAPLAEVKTEQIADASLTAGGCPGMSASAPTIDCNKKVDGTASMLEVSYDLQEQAIALSLPAISHHGPGTLRCPYFFDFESTPLDLESALVPSGTPALVAKISVPQLLRLKRGRPKTFNEQADLPSSQLCSARASVPGTTCTSSVTIEYSLHIVRTK